MIATSERAVALRPLVLSMWRRRFKALHPLIPGTRHAGTAHTDTSGQTICCIVTLTLKPPVAFLLC